MNIQELEQQIDATRHELDRTLQALQEKLSPGRRLKAAWGSTQAKSLGALRTGVNWAISHPVPVLAIAAAVVFAIWARPDKRWLR